MTTEIISIIQKQEDKKKDCRKYSLFQSLPLIFVRILICTHQCR